MTVCLGQVSIRFADSIRIAYSIPEIAFTVIDSKTTLESSVLGNRSTKLPDTATINDRFHIGSNTKAMTTFIIAKYVEKGKLKWTTKFFDIFPEWKSNSKEKYFEITLQDLLSYRARIQPFQAENDPTIPDFKGTKKENNLGSLL